MIMKVRIDQIQVKKRIRQDLGNLEPLMASLRRHGLINPILISPDFRLIAGERRFESAKRLGWRDIPVQIVEDSNQARVIELEIEENLHRKSLTSEELSEGYARLAKIRNPSPLRRFFKGIIKFFKRLFRIR